MGRFALKRDSIMLCGVGCVQDMGRILGVMSPELSTREVGSHAKASMLPFPRIVFSATST